MLSTFLTIVAQEFRLLRRDPTPFTILFIMPALSLVLFTPALGAVMREQGYANASGIELALPGMTVMFGSLGAAFLGFAIFREHQWHSWSRLLVSPSPILAILLGKMLVPIVLVTGQQLLLLALAVAVYDSSTPALLHYSLNALAFALTITALGLLTAASCRSLQQVNAIIHTLSLLLAASCGAFIPLETLPSWAQIAALITPGYWIVESQTSLLLTTNEQSNWTGFLCLIAQAGILLTLAAMRFKTDEQKYNWA